MIALFYIFLFLFLLLCLVLCGLVLVQDSKSMGLGSSFGVDSGDSVFGVSTPEILKKVTGWLAGVFCLGCLILSFATSYLGKGEEGLSVPQQYVEDFVEDVEE